MNLSAATDESMARRMWRSVEMIHAVTYFAEPCLTANQEAGCKGFWMGYFASRAAPMGRAPASVVEATFFGFHSSRVGRAIPDAWEHTDPATMIAARSAAAASVLRSLEPRVEEVAATTTETLQAIIAAADVGGRPLFAANRDLRPTDPVESLWQECTSLREHRGDGHVASLVAAGFDGCEANVLQAAIGTVPDARLRESRAWPVQEWASARTRLIERGLVDRAGGATDAGRALRADIERRTDDLAGAPMSVLEPAALDEVLKALDVVAAAVASSQIVPFPNPIGLPAR